jgi:hypothetical protein
MTAGAGFFVLISTNRDEEQFWMTAGDGLRWSIVKVLRGQNEIYQGSLLVLSCLKGFFIFLYVY